MSAAPPADASQRARYREAARAIRRYVMRHCLTREGAFAAFEGSDGVDISAALLPVWSFCAADAPEMNATMRVLHRACERDGLFRREDDTPAGQYEGAFFPGTFWVARYWAVPRDRDRARRYIDIGLAHANDLGIFPESFPRK